MRRKILTLSIGLLMFGLAYGQKQSDTVYYSTSLVPRFGINGQKGYGYTIFFDDSLKTKLVNIE